MDASIAQWSFWIDRGGTFTDVIGVHPDGRLESLKLLSELRGGYADAALEGIRRFLGIASNEPIPAGQIREVRMGTTVGTNALLEKTGEPTALAITAGLEDVLEIGYQNRPDLFALHIQKPQSLYAAVIPIVERVDAQGRVLQPIDPQQIKNQLDEIYQRGIRSLAIVLMHSYIYAEHEKSITRIARDIGFTQVSVSHEVSPAIRIIRRGDTTVVDAYLSPVLRRYLHQLRRDLQGVPLYFMQSHGGLTGAEAFRGRDSLLSGPAGGVVGGVAIGAQAGRNRLLGFDMGGTSTDVWHYNGELERAFECEIAGVRLQTPMLDIHTVAAGGGSILSYDDKRLQVGPRSAGADPGPVCYGRGGPLSLTDANVLLGRIQPDFFPALFGADGRQTLDADAVRYHFERRASEIKADSGVDRGMYEIARGYFDIAITHMAGAVKKISVERGYNPEEYTLCCFGGAGGQHACALADRLGIREILVHPLAGVLSAYGIGLADWRCLKETYIGLPIFECSLEDLVFAIDGLKNEGRQWLHEQGIAETLNTRHSVRYVTRAHMKYAGSDTILDVAWNEIPAMVSEFESNHRRLFGFDRPENPIILAKLVVETIGTIAINEIFESTTVSVSTPDTNPKQVDTDPPEPARYVQMYIDAPAMVPLFTVASIQDGRTIQGPAVVSAPNDTLVIDPGWQAVREANAGIRLTKVAIDSATIDNPNFEKQPTDSPGNKISTVDSENYANQVTLNRTEKNPADIARVNEAYRNNRTHEDRTRFDPVRLEIFHHVFRSIAGEMGAVLRQTGMSVNIKERLDFSCALFDERGRMIANAPHIPVHLGSMSECVQAVIRKTEGQMQNGDVFVLNNPYSEGGGTHLPDITVVTPIFLTGMDSPAFYTASRGHHADVGGITPGSMPPFSTSIEEEGVVIDVMLLCAKGELRYESMATILGEHRYPVRNLEQNINDLNAQVAANERGKQLLLQLVAKESAPVVRAYMRFIRENAAASVRRAIRKLKSGNARTELDNGLVIQIEIRLNPDTGSARFDFTGSSAIHAGNFNTPRSVVQAAILYVLRTLVDEEIPLNSGCLEPVEIHIPENCFLNPAHPAAVVAGNVETSQALVDTLYAALGVLAASQGTMNNFSFGNASVQYYETICGGAGAGPEFPGAHAVQTHMTNSRLTDPEVLEDRFPVRLEGFHIRRGSGGRGKFSGGDGVVRRIRFLAPMSASILSNRRRTAPGGLAGGGDGLTGQNYVERIDGEKVRLNSCDTIELQAGDVFVIATPGGGAFGPEVK